MENSAYFLGGSAFVFVLSLVYSFSNGLRNGPLIVATVVSTRAISPTRAFLLCAASEFCGAVLFGSAVVFTISQKMFGPVFRDAPRQEILLVLGSAVGASIVWGSLCYLRAIPSSNNHALFGGFAGASWAAWGVTHLFNSTLIKGIVILILTPVVALMAAILLTVFLRWSAAWMTPRVVPFADKLHVLSAMLVASTYGSNDSQMAISVAMLALDFAGSSVMTVPLWMKFAMGGFISLGTLMGGRRIIRKLGMSFYRIEILQGVGSQLAAAGIILGSITSGFPASSSQVITGAILGAGVAKNPRDVRWTAATDIVLSWFVTFPAVAVFSWVIYKTVSWMAEL